MSEADPDARVSGSAPGRRLGFLPLVNVTRSWNRSGDADQPYSRQIA